jgi:hypothetical protein
MISEKYIPGLLFALGVVLLFQFLYIDTLSVIGLGGEYSFLNGLGIIYILISLGLALTRILDFVRDQLSELGISIIISTFTIVSHALIWLYVPAEALSVSNPYLFIPVSFSVTAGFARNWREKIVVITGLLVWSISLFANIPLSTIVIVVVVFMGVIIAGLPVYLCARTLRAD